MTTSAIERLSLIHAYRAIRAALARAEDEYPRLAAPDGTVAVKIEHLRAITDETESMMNVLALGRRRWIGRWYGSEPDRGQSIHVVNAHGGHGELVAYLGDAKGIHEAADALIAAHNAALISEGIPV